MLIIEVENRSTVFNNSSAYEEKTCRTVDCDRFEEMQLQMYARFKTAPFGTRTRVVQYIFTTSKCTNNNILHD